jgi:hypothetical protein
MVGEQRRGGKLYNVVLHFVFRLDIFMRCGTASVR